MCSDNRSSSPQTRRRSRAARSRLVLAEAILRPTKCGLRRYPPPGCVIHRTSRLSTVPEQDDPRDRQGLHNDASEFRRLGGVRPRGSTDPERVEVDRGAALTVAWTDGHVSRFPLVPLRRSCTCATCRNLRDEDRVIWPRPGVPERLEVTHAEFAGGWGISLHWNDGHSTGIYAWDVLRAWCPCRECRSDP